MPSQSPFEERLLALRGAMSAQNLDAFLIPLADEHQGEYVPAQAQRLAWLTGFTGSAGMAIVTATQAAIFVDGRYRLQVTHEVDGKLYAYSSVTTNDKGVWPPAEWIKTNLPAKGKLAFDPWLHTDDEVERFKKIVAKAGGELIPCDENPVDQVWPDQPDRPMTPLVPHEEMYAGLSSKEKRTQIASSLKADGVDAVFLSAPDSIAWLLNLRGGDVPYTPLPLAFALLDQEGRVSLFVDSRKVGEAVASHLGDEVSLFAPDALVRALDQLATDKKRVQVSKSTAPHKVSAHLRAGGAQVVYGEDPCTLPKAQKNATELAGAVAAHDRDGVALTRFLHWLDETTQNQSVDELSAAAKLESFRAENDRFKGLSFPTISAAGPNGAIVHYRVDEASNRVLEKGSLYLVDSGAQYLDGTTDVTRTVAIGEPTEEMRERFTLVLKGHIAIASAIFPTGTTGTQLDILARQALWRNGLDYDHGTGHGVGSYLGVHEGPHRISKAPSRVPLEPGMIVSNEPGYYKTGEYGIRIENLILVEHGLSLPGGEKDMLRFSPLTMAPIDQKLIDKNLLGREEILWLDQYHTQVRKTLSPHLNQAEKQWLATVTATL
jgi:Xaa-Pro aminopeptidase